MITIGMNYQILPGKNEAFEKACNGVINAMADMDGHTKSFLFKDVNNPQSYLIMSDWSDRAPLSSSAMWPTGVRNRSSPVAPVTTILNIDPAIFFKKVRLT
jgi:hypothetical protein